MTDDGSRRLRRIKVYLERRAFIYSYIRTFFRNNGFLEVETPLRVPVVAPEKYINPFSSDGWFLSTSPELQMKRLIASGYERIYQICHCFRQEEKGRHHNPEFTMLEWYRADADYNQIIQDTEQLVLYIANRLGTGSKLPYQGEEIDLSLPWPRTTVHEAFLKSAGWDPIENYDALRFDIDLAEKVIPGFARDRPTIIMDYPIAGASLSRLKPGNPLVAERAEVFFGALEIANAYGELNDAVEQEQRFKEEIEQIKLAGRQAAMPEKFLQAITHLPRCSGIALGIDRLVMLFCDTDSINDVIAFPSDIV